MRQSAADRHATDRSETDATWPWTLVALGGATLALFPVPDAFVSVLVVDSPAARGYGLLALFPLCSLLFGLAGLHAYTDSGRPRLALGVTTIGVATVTLGTVLTFGVGVLGVGGVGDAAVLLLAAGVAVALGGTTVLGFQSKSPTSLGLARRERVVLRTVVPATLGLFVALAVVGVDALLVAVCCPLGVAWAVAGYERSLAPPRTGAFSTVGENPDV